MNYKTLAKPESFHGHLDTELVFTPGGIVKYKPGRVGETKATKRFIIRERDLSYRFYLHEHPYVRELIQRLLREGTAGLQAADTLYDSSKASLPGSIEIEISADSLTATVSKGSRIALLKNVQATSGSGAIELGADMEVKLAEDAQVTFPSPSPGGPAATNADGESLKATLLDGLPLATTAGSVMEIDGNREAVVSADARGALTESTLINLYDGSTATLLAGTTVLVTRGSLITVKDGSKVRLLKRKPLPVLFGEFFDAYQPNADLVQRPYPVKDLDFTSSGAYSIYNWELFYHVPITIAIHLSKNHRFAEAQQWFHYIFDPTDDSDGPTPERFWKVRPFQYTDVKKIEEILVNLATGADEALRRETVSNINAWREAPFRPHLIARYRQQAYMYKTVMAYLDNLIAWGDSLFRQDTPEAIDEAMMVYVLAANILGPRPQPVPKKGSIRPQTYANLKKDLKEFGIVLRHVEADLPFDLMPFPTDDAGDDNRLATLSSLGKALYFCVPPNDRLLSYWDTVAERLFKIRNSLNYWGTFRQLPLFEPPIDPAMLARAAAAGLDIGAIINGLNQPLPLVRFQLLAQKAAEIVQEVKSLGNNLLSAMEKEDNEELALLRAKHERVVMKMVERVKYAQQQEATKSKEGLFQSLDLAVQRYTYYERQLGKKADEVNTVIEEAKKALGELDKGSLEKMTITMNEPKIDPRDIEVDIAEDLGESGGKIMSSHEQQEFLHLKSAQRLKEEGANLNRQAKFLSLIPEFGSQAQPMGVGAAIQFGGRALSTQLSLAADAKNISAGRNVYEANKSAKISTYARREQDWAFQSNLAAGEIAQIFKQLRATQIREAIAKFELDNHQQQMKNAEEIESFLNEEGTEKTGKKTNKALYAWMKREVKGLYAQCFQFAFDIARKAERALQHELGNPELSFLQFGYLAGKEGLLAGEKLYLDVKRMEMAYHELNQREYELTKHVSLLQVDPLALLQLRATGRCTIRLPEELFDMDGPGHYFRRIKSVAVSIPCVTGPYASVNCTLTLLKSSIRKSPVLRDGVYARDTEDDRFSDYFGSLQSIVTSTAQNDSGLFETNLRDERYLPFENSGVDSEWQLQLPADPSHSDPAVFDYDTISDVVLHLRYTAREGGGLLRNAAIEHVKELIGDAQAAGSVRLFSVRHEFPTEWAKFKGIKIEGGTTQPELAVDIRQEHFPYWSKGRLEAIKRVDLFTKGDISAFEPQVTAEVTKYGPNGAEEKETPAQLTNIHLPDQFSLKFKLRFSDNSMEDLWVALAWGKAED